MEYENEDLFYVFPEFNKSYFTITINCFVYTDLALSKTTKLKSIYNSGEVADYIKDSGVDLWFLNDRKSKQILFGENEFILKFVLYKA